MPDAPTRFSHFLVQAEALPEHLGRLAQGAAALPRGGPVSPLHMVAVLKPWFDAQYLGGLALVRNPSVSPAADLVLRGLTELFAAVGWIFEGGPVSERECRAICYTLGVVRSMLDSLKARPSEDPEASSRLKELGELEEQIRRQRKEEGCNSAPWTYKKVGAALRDLSAKHEDLSWAYESWLWASTVAHHSIPLVPEPEAAEPAPTFVERGIQLLRFVHIYVNYGMVLLRLDHPGKVPEWGSLADALVQEHTFKDALEGRLDGTQAQV